MLIYHDADHQLNVALHQDIQKVVDVLNAELHMRIVRDAVIPRQNGLLNIVQLDNSFNSHVSIIGTATGC